MKLWKRNAVVAAIVLFVCVAVYLNWSYDQGQSVSGMGSAAANVTSERNLGEAALVNSDGALGLEEGSASSSAAASPKTEDKTAQKNKDAKTTSDDYFATARVNREEARDNSLSILQKTVNDPKASKDAVDAASKSITAMASATLQESKIESLVTAKGYTDCVAFIGDNSVSVVVKAKNNALKASDVAKITDIVEKYSVNAALKSTTKADVTLLTLDATEGVSQQDKRLMDLLDTRKIPFMVLVNKCDLVPAGQLKQLLQNVSEMLAFCKHVPILTVSALKGTGLNKILPMARKIHEECAIRVPTGQLNRAMEEVLTRHQPPVVKRVRAKFFYLTQAESQPPTFVFFVSDADRVPESYARYLERALRRIFGITHAPMRLHLRSSHKKSQ